MTTKELLTDPVGMAIALPMLAGIVAFLIPRALESVRGYFAALAATATCVFGIMVWTGPQGTVAHETIEWLAFRMDGLSSLALLAITGFGVLVTLYSIGYMAGRERLREYYAYVLWTIGASAAAVLTNDLVLLLSLWGFLGMMLYLLISIAGPDASAAAKKTFIIIGGTDCLLLLGVAILWTMKGTREISMISMKFDSGLVYGAFFCFVAAAFAKAGAIPFHTWVPDCGEKAPVSVTAFLPASLDKLLGIYLLARVAMPGSLFDLSTSPVMGALLMFLGAATVLTAVMMALVQHDMKRLLSFHAVSQVGYMVLGIASGTPVGIAGGLFHMLNNTIYKACLFLSAGSVEKKTGTTDMDRLGGLGRLMPLTFGAFFVAAMAISGIPPLNGFASKWMVYQGIIEAGKEGTIYRIDTTWIILLAAAMLGSALTLASFVKILHAVFLCKADPALEKKKITEVGPTMWLPGLVLAGVCVLFGVVVYKIPLKYFIAPAVAGFTKEGLLGAWYAGPATVALLSAFALGLMIYLLTSARKVRECETYVGGEIMEDVYVEGTEAGPARSMEVTGTGFYRTVEDLTPETRSLYDAARRKLFDTYDVGQRVAFYFTEALRSAHTGRLPTYLTWMLAGLLVLVIALRKLGNG